MNLLLHISFILIIIGAIITSLAGDPKNLAGLAFVFGGFILYAVAGMLCLIKYFRRRLMMLIILSIGAFSLQAAGKLPVIPLAQADSLAAKSVIYEGRVIPFSNLANQLTRKLTGKDHVGKADDVQFIASMMLYPEEWMQTPFLKVKGARLRARLAMSDKYISPTALYDSLGQYRLAALYTDGTTPLDKEILEVDEKMELLDLLMRGELFTPLSAGDPRELPAWKKSLIIAYDRVQPWKIWFMLALTAGFIGLLLPICLPIKSKSSLSSGNPTSPTSYKFIKFIRVAIAAIPAASAILSYIWLWLYIGRPPMVGHSEVMLLLATALSIIALLLALKTSPLPSPQRVGVKSPLQLPTPAPTLPTPDSRLPINNSNTFEFLSLLLAGGFAMTGWIGLRDAMVSPLMPALASPWLSIHVSVIMTAYALLGLTLPAAIGILATKKEAKQKELHLLCLDLLHPGVYLLGIGIITGSVWADSAWGRYWAWDPKETWALITWLLYALPFHFPLLRKLRMKLSKNSQSSQLSQPSETTQSCQLIRSSQPSKPSETTQSSQLIRSPQPSNSSESASKYRRRFALYLILPFLSILMTYIGVSYLPSLHSY